MSTNPSLILQTAQATKAGSSRRLAFQTDVKFKLSGYIPLNLSKQCNQGNVAKIESKDFPKSKKKSLIFNYSSGNNGNNVNIWLQSADVTETSYFYCFLQTIDGGGVILYLVITLSLTKVVIGGKGNCHEKMLSFLSRDHERDWKKATGNHLQYCILPWENVLLPLYLP